MSEDRRDDPPSGEERAPRGEPRRQPSLRNLARRLLFDEAPPPRGGGAEGEPDLDDDEQRRRLEARAVLAALLETGDKAKTETIRMVAREVRGYLEALELHKDLEHLLTNYSLEVKASIHLEPLGRDEAGRAERDPTASVGIKRKAHEPPEDEG